MSAETTHQEDERCPNCGVLFPVLHGPHPTWIPCRAPMSENAPSAGDQTDSEAGR